MSGIATCHHDQLINPTRFAIASTENASKHSVIEIFDNAILLILNNPMVFFVNSKLLP